MLSRDRAFIKWLFFSAGTLFICVCLKVKVMLLCRQCSRLGRQSELSSVGNWVEAEAWDPLRALKGVLCVWVTFRWKSQRTFGPVCERSVGANTELPPWNSGSKYNRHIYMRGRKFFHLRGYSPNGCNRQCWAIQVSHMCGRNPCAWTNVCCSQGILAWGWISNRDRIQSLALIWGAGVLRGDLTSPVHNYCPKLHL